MTRRTAMVGLTLTALAVSGCGSEALRSSAPAQQDSTDTGADPDVVGTSVANITAALAVTAQVGERYPGLTGRLAGLVAVHQAHLAELDAPAPAATPPSPLEPTTRRAALAAVSTSSLLVQQQHAAQSVVAESGELARLLAAMSAAVAQQLSILDVTQ